MNKTLIAPETIAAEIVHNDWVFMQWLDLSTTRLCKLPIKCETKNLNPAIDEMNAEICERIS
jgi:hypothetical protein